jgi:hypothetical protein
MVSIRAGFAVLTFRSFVSCSLLCGLWIIGAAHAQEVQVQMRDGGTREVLESIYIPPMARSPFTLTLTTEWIRPMGSGGTYTLENTRHIMRDSQGRIYEERWLLVPKGGKMESRMNVFQIADPVKHTLYNCFTKSKECDLLRYAGSNSVQYKPGMTAAGPLPDGSGYRTHEELGVESVDGFETTGYRDTTVLNPGVIGNDQPATMTREFWYSALLGINLRSLVESPQTGKQVFTVTNVSTSEPEPAVFAIPDDYRVVDQRKTEPAQ